MKEHFSDCENIIHVNTDTITLGDNLAHRIQQAERYVSFAKDEVERYRTWADDWEKDRFGKDYAEEHRAMQREAEKKLADEEAWLSALDSLMTATLDIANTPTAYTVWVQYNYVGNFALVQLSADGDLLVITKDTNRLLLNPGDDMPGYYELYCKHYGL